MKVILLGVMGLAVLTGASGPGPLKDELPVLFGARAELGRMRLELAELRSGRGSAAPGWVADYARAMCAMDARYVVEHTDPSIGITEEDMRAQFQRMSAEGKGCSSVRYLGSVGTDQFIFVLHHGPRDVWYLLTLSEDGRSILKLE
jgi:hypothetical protein